VNMYGRSGRDPRRCLWTWVGVVAMGMALCACGGGSGAGSAAPATTTAPTASTSTTRPVTLSQRAEASLPSAVQETAAAATATKLYVVGGYDANGQSVASVFVFDGARWANGPTFPIAVNHPAGAGLKGDVYVAGGFTSGSATNRVFVLAHGATTWKEVASMHTARAAAALLPVGRYLYVIGGLAGSTQIAQVERYDPATDTWTDITQMPRPRNHVAGYVEGELACIAGGREPSTSSSVDCLDTTTTSWRPGIPLATPTSGAIRRAQGAGAQPSRGVGSPGRRVPKV
jgi:hypothetical protein